MRRVTAARVTIFVCSPSECHPAAHHVQRNVYTICTKLLFIIKDTSGRREVVNREREAGVCGGAPHPSGGSQLHSLRNAMGTPEGQLASSHDNICERLAYTPPHASTIDRPCSCLLFMMLGPGRGLLRAAAILHSFLLGHAE